jgi:hypothetical protein
MTAPLKFNLNEFLGETERRHFLTYLYLVDTIHDILERPELARLRDMIPVSVGSSARAVGSNFPDAGAPVSVNRFFTLLKSLMVVYGLVTTQTARGENETTRKVKSFNRWLFTDSGLIFNSAGGNSKNYLAPVGGVAEAKTRILAYINDKLVRANNNRGGTSYFVKFMGRREFQEFLMTREISIDAGYALDIHRLVGASLKHKNVSKTLGSRITGKNVFTGGISQVLNSAGTSALLTQVNASRVKETLNGNTGAPNEVKLNEVKLDQATSDTLAKRMGMPVERFRTFKRFGKYDQVNGTSVHFYHNVKDGNTLNLTSKGRNDCVMFKSGIINIISIPRAPVGDKEKKTPYIVTAVKGTWSGGDLAVEIVFMAGRTLSGPPIGVLLPMYNYLFKKITQTVSVGFTMSNPDNAKVLYRRILSGLLDIKRSGDGFQTVENSIINHRAFAKNPNSFRATYLVTEDITALAIGICNGACMVLAASDGTHLVYSPVYIEKAFADGTYKSWKKKSLEIIKKHYGQPTGMGNLVTLIVNEVVDKKEDSVAFTLSTFVDVLDGDKMSMYANHHNNRYRSSIESAKRTNVAGLNELQTALAHPGGAFYFACLESIRGEGFVKKNSALSSPPRPMNEDGPTGVAHENNPNANAINTFSSNNNNTIAHRVKRRRR